MDILIIIVSFFLVKFVLNILRARDERPTTTQSIPTTAPVSAPRNVEPYRLGRNELPQGTYLIGRDIPPGTYDFFVVYGDGGKLDLAKRDEEGKIINGTWKFYWVGLKASYENREVVHVLCEEGFTLKITGNVILKIAKSQDVYIDL
jgi:hypothetical protein